MADSANVVAESNESNNIRCSSAITVTGGSPPDLVIAGVSAPLSATHGTTISVSDKTQNIGSVTAAASTTAVYINGTCSLSGATRLTSRAVPSLTFSGGYSTATYNVTLPATTGSLQLIWNADDANVVTESNEGNNTKCKAITVN